MVESELSILIRLRDQASAGLAKFNDQLKAQQKEAQKTKVAWEALAKTSAVLGAAIVGAMGLMVKGAEEERISIAKLTNMLENVGVAYGDVSKALEATMTATARKTGISDEAQRSALSNLIMVTGNYENSLKALPLALDLASARGIDAASAAWTLGKALAGNATMLKRYGIQVKENATAEEVLIAVNNAVGGSAAAMASPFAILKNEMSELGESIGKVLLPALSGIVKAATALLSPIKFLVERTGAFGKGMVFLAGVVGLAAMALAAYAAAQNSATVASLRQLPAMMVLAAKHIVTTAAIVAETAATWLLTAATTAYAAAAAAAAIAGLPLTVVVGIIVVACVAAAAAIYAIIKGLQWLVHWLGGTDKKAKDTAVSIKNLNIKMRELSDAIADAENEIQTLQEEYDLIQKSSAGYGEKVLLLNRAIAEQQRKIDGLTDSLSAARDELDALTNPNLAGMGKYKDQIFAIDQQLKKLQLLELQKGATAKTTAQIEALEKQRRILELQSQIDFEPTIHALEDIRDEATGASKEIAPQDAISRAMQLAAQIRSWGSELVGVSSSMVTNQTQMESYLTNMKALLDPIELQTARIRDNIFGWAEGPGGLKEQQAAEAALPETPVKKKRAWWDVGGTLVDSMTDMLGLASGGVVNKPTLAMIGESGPEAVVPLSQSGMGATNVYVTVQGSIMTEEDLVASIRKGLLQVKSRNVLLGLS